MKEIEDLTRALTDRIAEGIQLRLDNELRNCLIMHGVSPKDCVVQAIVPSVLGGSPEHYYLVSGNRILAKWYPPEFEMGLDNILKTHFYIWTLPKESPASAGQMEELLAIKKKADDLMDEDYNR